MTPASFLYRILERKRREVEAAARHTPEGVLRSRAESRKGRQRPFADRLARFREKRVCIIAEIKRASPSKGMICAHLEPERLAVSYENGGAAALSVLTDSAGFKGSPGDLKRARAAVSLPVLRKDFLFSFYQIYESAAMGADAVLLIVCALSRGFLTEALALCAELGMEALVEVHSETELDTACRAGARLVGINNRNLQTFATDIENSIRISRSLDDRCVAVAESGIRCAADVGRICAAGIGNFLIGEALVRAADPEALLRDLSGGHCPSGGGQR